MDRQSGTARTSNRDDSNHINERGVTRNDTVLYAGELAGHDNDDSGFNNTYLSERLHPSSLEDRPVRSDRLMSRTEPSAPQATRNAPSGPGTSAGQLMLNDSQLHQPLEQSPGRQQQNQQQLSLLVANDLQRMSKDERAHVLGEMHGVEENGGDEDQTTIKLCLDLIDAEIGKKRTKPAYNRTVFLSPRYAMDRRLRLMFLRANRFEVLRATQKYVSYFEHKLRLFGLDCLPRPLSTCNAIGPSEREVLESGSLQISPSVKDNQGRTLLFDVASHLCNQAQQLSSQDMQVATFAGVRNTQLSRSALIQSRVKVFWFLAMKALEDRNTQIDGVVAVVHCIHVHHCNNDEASHLSVIEEYLREIQVVSSCLPMRYVSWHFCYDHLALDGVLGRLGMSMSRNARVRIQMHVGNHAATQVYLGSFGISQELVPVDPQGNPRMTDEFRRYISRITDRDDVVVPTSSSSDLDLDGGSPSKSKGSARNEQAMQEPPTSLDVLLGRGKPFQEHPGNVRLQQLIDSFRAEHESSSFAAKNKLCKRIVDMIGESGGRFLKRTKDLDVPWVQANPSVARDKVSHSFRTKSSASKRASSDGGRRDGQQHSKNISTDPSKL